MSDIIHRELDLPCTPSEAWEQITDPSWLGHDGELPLTPGAEGWVSDDEGVHYVIVEEVDENQRYVYRWATFEDAPTRVEIELAPIGDGTRISISESPIDVRAQATLALR
jgi:uncharacterized protein YndB with AHSA1/START domain